MQTVVRLIGYVWPYRWLFAITLIGVVFLSMLETVKPLLIGMVVDRVIAGGEADMLTLLVGAILAAALVHGGIFYGTQYLRHYLGERVAYDIRNVLYRHIHYLEARFHDTSRTGELMSRVTSDVHAVRRFSGDGLYMCARILFRIVVVAGTAFFLSWKLTLIVMVVAPMLYLTVRRFKRQVEAAYLKFQSSMATMTATLQENITGVRIVRSFGQEEQEEAKYDLDNRNVLDSAIGAVRVRAQHGPMIEFWSVLSRGIMLVAGGWFVIQGEISIGVLVSFDGFLGRLMQPFRMLPNLLDMLGEGTASGARIFEVLDTQPSIRSEEQASKPPRSAGRVTFENISFNYAVVDAAGGATVPMMSGMPERVSAGFGSRGGGVRIGMGGGERTLIAEKTHVLPAIQGIDLDVRPQETVAILGLTGAGKSTLMHLINRTYDPDQGRVLLDGVDLRELPLQWLRRRVAVVPQESFLFSTTIFENIAYGKPDASLEEVVAAAKRAQAHEFITTLPRQYDTVIGERGARLSGGQRQRLTIARAILMRPLVLVIDDATSAVDTETEHLIWDALSDVMVESTTFIVAQRISTVQYADRILVIDGGRIVEEGTHDELLVNGRIYRRMHDVQIQAG